MSRDKARRVEHSHFHVCHTECKNPADPVPTNGGTCCWAFQGTVPEWAK